MKKLFLQMSSYSTANKAHEELQQYAKKWHYCLVDDQVLENAVIELEQEIDRINKKYTRCKDIKMEVFRDLFVMQREKNNCVSQLSVEGNFYISVHEVMRVELTPNNI